MSPVARRAAGWLCAPWLSAGVPQATAVVDRIASGFLVVEWADGTIGDLPARWWAGPRPAREGERQGAPEVKPQESRPRPQKPDRPRTQPTAPAKSGGGSGG